MTREPLLRRIRANGAELAVFEWAGEGPAVLLVHATGMHGRCWDAVVDALPGVHVFSLELRGHGRSEKLPPYTWDTMGRDVTAVAQQLGLRGAVGVGHSLGGFCILWAAVELAPVFRTVVLIDPVILSPAEEGARQSTGTPEAHFTARRRAHFDSPDEMYERFADREPYSRWRSEVLRAYCEHGLLPDAAEGGYTLACPPAVEAAVYVSRAGGDIHARAARLDVPATVLRARRGDGGLEARFDFSRSPTWPGLAAHMPRAKDVYLPEHSHFIPMEAPERVADVILAARAG